MKNLKLALLLSAAVMATSAQAQWDGNWLLGVSAGKAWQNDNEGFKVSVSSVTSSQLYNIANNEDNDGFIWGFLGGYQGRCHNFLAGIELNVDWRDDEDDVNFVVVNPVVGPVAATISHDRGAVVGITARFGYNVLPCLMPYIRLGVDYNERATDFIGATTALAENIPFAVDSSDDERWGFVGGAGIEYFMPFVRGLSLRAEWDYHTRAHSDNINAPLGEVVIPTSIGISDGGQHYEQTARASLVYNFPIY
ncbi:MAG: outer membrane beta-barrel protein [Proteobacteria bacterium]|nr:outer membrane beta-barrel protein [Pseudomonadota bacterium]